MVVVSDKLLEPPLDSRYLLVLGICGSCMMISLCSGVRLFLRHLRAGRERTGLLTPDEKAHDAMMFALSIPLFAGFSFLAVVLVELAAMWTFLQTLILALNFARIPGSFTGHVNGQIRLHELLKARSASMSPIQIFGLAPCCCMRPCAKARQPVAEDFYRLKVGIWQLCIMIPLLEFIDLIVGEEIVMGAAWIQALPARFVKLRQLVKVSSQFTCISSCKGLVELIAALEEDPAEKASLSAKLKYCQSYVLGMNLIPTLMWSLSVKAWGSSTLLNHEVLTDLQTTNFITNCWICIATVYVSVEAWRAFPLDVLPSLGRPLLK